MKPEDLSIEELQKILENKMKEAEAPEKDDSKANVRNDFTVSKDSSVGGKSKRTVVAGENTWSDTGEHKDVTTPDVERGERKRRSPKKVELNCHVCGKKFEILSSLVSGKYVRCDSCVR